MYTSAPALGSTSSASMPAGAWLTPPSCETVVVVPAGGALRRFRRFGLRRRLCNRRDRRRRGFRRALLLHLRELLVLQREELLQVRDISFEFLLSRLRLAQRARARRGVVLARRARAGRRWLAGLGLRQPQLIGGRGGLRRLGPLP